jgi:tRNA threonylcarbamoyladenosine biosynthesis protein TsaE
MNAAPERHVTHGEAETIALARSLGVQLPPGTTILLYGDLGAGKTAFVRGLAEGLGADPNEVSSPTFTLIQEYAGRTRLFHADLYRLSPAEADDLGLDELAGGEGVLAIEWADRLARPIPGALAVRITDRGADVREIEISRPAD